MLAGQFPAVWNGPLQSPRRHYVQDLPDDVICDGTKLVPVLERREFAVPVPSDRASGTVAGKPGRRVRDVTTLDPADPVDRQLITVNDLSARMISQHSFGNYVAVVEQLWAGYPPELWSTAKRMLDARLSREAVLDHVWRRERRVATVVMADMQRSQERDADLVGAALKHGGQTLAVAESLTGGLLASAFARASGASEWFRGGIVAYSRAVKYNLLAVPAGPVVSQAAAVAMARGASCLLEADVAVAVTGVGGPGSQDGEPPGTVWAATWPDPLGDPVLLRLRGSPESICEQACTEVVRMLRERLAPTAAGTGPDGAAAGCHR